jgi:hypothetical protein
MLLKVVPDSCFRADPLVVAEVSWVEQRTGPHESTPSPPGSAASILNTHGHKKENNGKR